MVGGKNCEDLANNVNEIEMNFFWKIRKKRIVLEASL